MLCFVVVAAVIALVQNDRVARPGDEIRYDDMAFSVFSLRSLRELPGGLTPRWGVVRIAFGGAMPRTFDDWVSGRLRLELPPAR